jgi:hypothetical protein
MPTFPLAPPAAFKATKVSIDLSPIAALQRSAFTGQGQVHVWGDGFWQVTLDTPTRRRASGGADISAFITALRGVEGTFLWSPPGAEAPRGSVPAQGLLISGAGQTGRSLTLAGASAWSLVADDWISLGSGLQTRLHRVVAGVVSAGAQNIGTVEIEPALRAVPANGAAVVVIGAQGLWRLASNSNPLVFSAPDKIGASLTFTEAL